MKIEGQDVYCFSQVGDSITNRIANEYFSLSSLYADFISSEVGSKIACTSSKFTLKSLFLLKTGPKIWVVLKTDTQKMQHFPEGHFRELAPSPSNSFDRERTIQNILFNTQ